jgi:hypothetical protein
MIDSEEHVKPQLHRHFVLPRSLSSLEIVPRHKILRKQPLQRCPQLRVRYARRIAR